jgi:hypothetical protein
MKLWIKRMELNTRFALVVLAVLIVAAVLAWWIVH